MTNKILIIFFIILTICVVYIIDNGVRTHDLRFYSGKDTGYFIRIESIVILNTIFYVLKGFEDKKQVINCIALGFIGGIISLFISVLCYLFVPSDYYGLTFHVTSLLFCYSSYFILKKLRMVLTANKQKRQNDYI